uniref:dihydropteroate synthase n=1 Tax=Pasteurella multocida TaxID=747 RepID=UPI0015BD5B5F
MEYTSKSQIARNKSLIIFGIVNITSDSFSDGGRYLAPDAAIAQARKLMAEY